MTFEALLRRIQQAAVGTRPVTLTSFEAAEVVKRLNPVRSKHQIIMRLTLVCPECGKLHVDVGEWATKPHRTHLCLGCGCEWEVTVVGVAP